jgi:hypothetical protein
LEEIVDRLAWDNVMNMVLGQDGLKLFDIESQAEVCAEDQCFMTPAFDYIQAFDYV